MPVDHEATERLLNELLSDRPDDVVDLALATRSMVHELARAKGEDFSELVYCSYSVSDVFSFTGKLGQATIHIATYAKHMNLGFNHGAELADPKKILHGTGKAIRHAKIKTLDDLKTKPVKDLVRAAIKQAIELAKQKDGIQEAVFVYNGDRKKAR